MDKTGAVLAVEPLILAVTDPDADEAATQKARQGIAHAIGTLCGMNCRKGMTLPEHVEAATTAHTGAREAALLL